MRYIAVDTSHFILVLFCFVAYSKPIPSVVMVLEILRYSTIDNLTMPFVYYEGFHYIGIGLQYATAGR